MVFSIYDGFIGLQPCLQSRLLMQRSSKAGRLLTLCWQFWLQLQAPGSFAGPFGELYLSQTGLSSLELESVNACFFVQQSQNPCRHLLLTSVPTLCHIQCSFLYIYCLVSPQSNSERQVFKDEEAESLKALVNFLRVIQAGEVNKYPV